MLDEAIITGLLARCQRARTDLSAFVDLIHPQYVFSDFSYALISVLEDEQQNRVMLSAPPQHGKSRLFSQLYPAWQLGRRPDDKIISISNSSSLAVDWGRTVRNIISSPMYQLIFPDTKLSEDKAARDNWETTAGGMYYATGIGGSFVGRPGRLILMDDLLKGHKDADSELSRETIYKSYLTDVYSRIQRDTRILYLSTRWHEDDLSGRLIADMQRGIGERWETWNFPAIKDGRALVPQLHPLEQLEQTRRMLPRRVWDCLYQGAPTSEEGRFFTANMFAEYDPEDIGRNIQTHGIDYYRFYGSSDYATTEDEGDFTVHLVFAVDPAGRIYLVARYHEQETSDKWVEAFLQLNKQFPIKLWAEEQGQIIKSVGPFLKREMKEAGVRVNRKQFTSSTNKVARARSAQGRFNVSPLYLPTGQPWVESYRKELLGFWTAKHDDQVDTTSLFCRMLNELRPGDAPAPPVPEPQDLLEQPLDEIVKWHDRQRRNDTQGWIR